MSNGDENITIIFLNLSDADQKTVLSRPPMISALQGFETMLLLIAEGRFPAALAVCINAIESSWKAHSAMGPDDRVFLAEVLGGMRSALPREAISTFSSKLTTLREKRNQITHFGFSKQDDEESMSLLLSTAIPLLDAWIQHAIGVKVVESLVYDLGDKIRQAIGLVSQRSSTGINLSAIDAIRGVRHWILHHTRLSYLPEWEQEILDQEASSGWRGWEIKQRLMTRVQNEMDPYAVIDCPICKSGDSMVVRLDDAALEANQLIPLEVHCVECGLQLPESASPLVIEICRSELTPSLLDETRRQYGMR
jgi:hypothetical protein